MTETGNIHGDRAVPKSNAWAPLPGAAEGDAQTMSMMVALTAELVVVRGRLDTLERVLANSAVIGPSAIEDFTPSAQDEAEREIIRTRTIEAVFGSLRTAAEVDLATAKLEK